MKARSVCALLVLVAALTGGCDKASPVAPAGTTLSISASPSQIAASGEVSTIRVTAIRPNGTPAFPGTQVRLDTSLGVVTPLIETDAQGVALGELRGDGRIGMATVSARTGATEAVTVEVEIGKFAESISLQASPTQVSEAGGSISLLALVRDDQGSPLAGAQVNFESEVGTLRSRGALITTDASGQARDTLVVTADDTRAFNAPSFTVRAVVGGGGTKTATATIRIASAAPIITFVARNAGEFKVFFDNQTQGQRPIAFEWDFQNDGTVDSTAESPTFDYGNAGTFTVRLTGTNDFGTDTEIRTITVPVP